MNDQLSICLEGFRDDDKKIRIAVGAALMGCGYEVGGCDPFIEQKNSEIIIVSGGRITTIIKEGDGEGDGVFLNIPAWEAYVHKLRLDGRPRSAYMTDAPIDQLVFTGALACSIGNTSDLVTAFNKVMDILSINPRLPFQKLWNLVKEYGCMKRLSEAAQRINSHAGRYRHVLGRTVTLGCRPSKGTLILIEGVIVGDSAVYGAPLITTTEIHAEYSSVDPGSSFICTDKSGGAGYERYGLKTIGINGLKCLIGEDPVRLLIILEKRPS